MHKAECVAFPHGISRGRATSPSLLSPSLRVDSRGVSSPWLVRIGFSPVGVGLAASPAVQLSRSVSAIVSGAHQCLGTPLKSVYISATSSYTAHVCYVGKHVNDIGSRGKKASDKLKRPGLSCAELDGRETALSS